MKKNTLSSKSAAKREPRAQTGSAITPARVQDLQNSELRAQTSAAPIPRKHKVSLEFVHPGARQVAVAGSFNAWKPEVTLLNPIGSDRWVGNLELTPGRHEYLFVVDGQWVPDPKAPEAVQNPFGGRNSILEVRE